MHAVINRWCRVAWDLWRARAEAGACSSAAACSCITHLYVRYRATAAAPCRQGFVLEDLGSLREMCHLADHPSKYRPAASPPCTLPSVPLVAQGRDQPRDQGSKKPRELLCAPRPVPPSQHPGGGYSLYFAQRLHSAPTRRCSGWIWLPEEPFVLGHGPASVKSFCLFGLMGKKFILRNIRKLPGLSVVPQLLLEEAASMLCRGCPRTGDGLTPSWLPLL